MNEHTTEAAKPEAASEMVDRVARALNSEAMAFDAAGKLPRATALGLAWAAIAAMREPTEAMVTASVVHPGDMGGRTFIANCWRRMIDAALASPGTDASEGEG